ncbi:hypothetical protein HPP92_018491 [Vanilla planifolia]|uniref:Tac7077 n=1 Tax=Vanilla planifolia TaxID=51239 RepID=A0A835UN09_VANPL|nr:hypothetical protein HPP92_019108 [Vanilla planifolia]KAG0469163.1 hypothetical protein HPP92_018491 [Vanilla planifolia]
MASSMLHFFAISCNTYGLGMHGCGGRTKRMGFIESHGKCCGVTSRCKGYSDGSFFRRLDDGSTAPCAVASPSQLFLDSGIHLGEQYGENLVNGFGKPLHFPGERKAKRLSIAVDVDEVLGSFLSALNKFVARHYASNHKISEYYVYEFFRIWNCTRAEADIRVHEFFKSLQFRSGIDPIPGAQSTLLRLSTFCDLSIVTSRQNVIKEHTIEWIEKHYPGIFKEIQFGNHFALDGKSRPKSEICRSLGVQVLIDDNPMYALECAKVGIKVLLFDYQNSYPWSKDVAVVSHSMVTTVSSWEEVEQQLTLFTTVLE